MGEDRRDNNVWVQVSHYASLAMLLPLSTFIGYVIGYFLDKAFGTHFLFIVFLLFGIAAGIIQLMRELAKDPQNRAL
jgi:F0F1-type ATP synthase assembly protein I